jgi:hypothetical protein
MTRIEPAWVGQGGKERPLRQVRLGDQLRRPEHRSAGDVGLPDDHVKLGCVSPPGVTGREARIHSQLARGAPSPRGDSTRLRGPSDLKIIAAGLELMRAPAHLVALARALHLDDAGRRSAQRRVQ